MRTPWLWCAWDDFWVIGGLTALPVLKHKMKPCRPYEHEIRKSNSIEEVVVMVKEGVSYSSKVVEAGGYGGGGVL